jgi:hypothetical protein
LNYEYGVADPLALTFQTMANLAKHDPSRFYAFVDEHPDTMYFGGGGLGDFSVYFLASAGKPYLIHLPSARHHRASPLSFTDGHAEMHRWIEPSTYKPVNGTIATIYCPGSKDHEWFTNHASVQIKRQP